MAGRSGTAVVLDVDKARIVAQYRVDIAARKLAHPGSTLKPFTLLALLEHGKLDPTSSVMCRRTVHIGNRHLDCSHVETVEPLDALNALAYSCNHFFAHFSKLLTNSELTESLRRAGLTSPTGFVAEEATGTITHTNNAEQHQLQALGEANVEITPLELLAAYHRLALRRKQPESSRGPLRTIFEGLEASTLYGTGKLAEPPGLRIAGKTGTATAVNGRWTHAWFAGYAPADNPEIVLVIFLERGRGGADAGPIAREIFAAYQALRASR